MVCSKDMCDTCPDCCSVPEVENTEESSSLTNGDLPNGLQKVLSNSKSVDSKKESKNDSKEDKDSEVEPGKKCQLKALEERFNKDGAAEVVEVGSYMKGSKQRFEDFALVTKRIFKKDNTLRTATLTVNSPHILRILRETVGSYATQPAGFDVPIVEEAPFALFFHFKDNITAYEPENEEVREHHKLLLDWIEIEMGNISKEVERLTKKGYITFPLLWTIFKPGDLMYSSSHGHPRLFKLDNVVYKDIPGKGQLFETNSTYVDYNGTHVGFVREKTYMFNNRLFTGKSPNKITSLPIFPRKFVDDDSLEERLTIRGTRMLSYKGVLTMQYDGLLEFLKMPPWSWWGPECERDGVWTPMSITGRVIVDKKTFAEDYANETAQLDNRAIDAADEAGPDSDAQNAYLLSSHSYSKEEEVLNPMFCPPFTIGYALDRKVWCRFFIDQLQPIEWLSNPMDELILPQKQKKVLQALVGSHRFPEQSRDEWVTKGKGLVILLHGTPGSGKTLTAECAAEYTKKALLKISLAELRDDDRLEQNMIRFQRYASTWKAIVLIDEADVFLEARTSEGKDSADRNALVAVFLRTLEYFQGIIFLTSNRVSVFDQAIKSRIHLALQYSPPDDSARQRLWHNALSALPAGTTDFKQGLEKVVFDLAEAEMNGREISNSIHTALTLARDEEKKLGREHLDTIISVWTAFAKTLDGEHGMKNGRYTL